MTAPTALKRETKCGSRFWLMPAVNNTGKYGTGINTIILAKNVIIYIPKYLPTFPYSSYPPSKKVSISFMSSKC